MNAAAFGDELILTVDVGTSSVKAVLYDTAGRVLATAQRRYGYQSPQPGWAEADPQEWWEGTRQAIQELAGMFDLGRVAALSCTGQMHTAVFLDEQGRVIPPTILWLDRRASHELDELQSRWHLPPYELNSTYTLPKLYWLSRHHPEVLARVHKIIWPKDYIRYRLTGEICTDLTEAGGAALLDWRTRDWTLDRLEAVGLSARVLPEVRPADGSGGSLLPDVAAELGLNPAAKVVVGMGDVAALFGGAPLRPGRVICSMGSSSMVFMPCEPGREVHDPLRRLYVYPFGPCPMLGGVSSTTGASLVWAFEQIFQGPRRDIPFAQCIEEALAVPPGAEGLCFLPYLAGERSPYWSDHIRGGFYGLRLGHETRHLVRAVMEGVVFSLRHLLDIYQEIGAPADEIALAGGGTQTAGWPQMIADICQLPVLVYAEQETVTRVLYALCMVHLGRGEFVSLLERTFGEPERFNPHVEQAPVYEPLYRTYRLFSEFAYHVSSEGH